MIDYQEQFFSNFYCVLFSFAVIALDGGMLWELFYSALNLDLRFATSQRLWLLVGVWSCGSWIWIWFTSVTIRLSNRFCKFTAERFFGDTQLGDAMFVLFLDLVFTVSHSSAHLSFVISISITACWFLISFLRHWFSLVYSCTIFMGSFNRQFFIDEVSKIIIRSNVLFQFLP